MEPFRQRFDAVPESVTRARHVVSEHVRNLGADDACVQSAALAVSEAVSNSARHAYPDSSGAVELSARLDGRREIEIEIAIRDEGRGHESVSANPGGGFGIPIMRRVAREFTLTSGPTGGTEVRMRFPLPPQ